MASVVVTDHYSESTPEVFHGSEDEIKRSLLHHYPWLFDLIQPGDDLHRWAALVNSAQALSATVKDANLSLIMKSEKTTLQSMIGPDHSKMAVALESARFLANDYRPLTDAEIRAALNLNDEDACKAALSLIGWEATTENLQTMSAIMGLKSQGYLSKSEDEPEVPQGDSVIAVTSDGYDCAKEVAGAFKEGDVKFVELGGKHSKGTMLARGDGVWLLKPNVGTSPAAGEAEETATPAKKEAAFFMVSKLWGLNEYLAETHVLAIDGKEYAAIKMLGNGYKNFNDIRQEDPNMPRRFFRLFAGDGTLYKFALLDYVLGNVDRNAGNVMARGGDLKLIDHGSAFAGESFSPKTDPSTFVPYYLRAMTSNEFNMLTPQKKLALIPRLGQQVAKELTAWILSLDASELVLVHYRYGISPVPSENRLKMIQAHVQSMAPDLAIATAWL